MRCRCRCVADVGHTALVHSALQHSILNRFPKLAAWLDNQPSFGHVMEPSPPLTHTSKGELFKLTGPTPTLHHGPLRLAPVLFALRLAVPVRVEPPHRRPGRAAGDAAGRSGARTAHVGPGVVLQRPAGGLHRCGSPQRRRDLHHGYARCCRGAAAGAASAAEEELAGWGQQQQQQQALATGAGSS